MPTENVKIERPIEIKDNSIERVAFDLMITISDHEAPVGIGQKPEIRKDRYYWLSLYDSCLKTVEGQYYKVKPKES